jgi:hypothetical protein
MTVLPVAFVGASTVALTFAFALGGSPGGLVEAEPPNAELRDGSR